MSEVTATRKSWLKAAIDAPMMGIVRIYPRDDLTAEMARDALFAAKAGPFVIDQHGNSLAVQRVGKKPDAKSYVKKAGRYTRE